MRAAIIAAGGVGERFGATGGKQLALAAGEPLLVHTLRAFQACDAVDAIVVVAHPARLEEYITSAVDPARADKVVAVVAGGATRQESVRAGLEALPRDVEFVAVHDGARSAIEPETIARAFAALESDPAAAGVVVGHPLLDTVKRVGADGVVLETPDRSELWVAQTPQVFRGGALREAHARAAAESFIGTDDASLVERAGGTVRMVEGPRWNLKVTLPEDVTVLESLLDERAEDTDR